MLPVIISALALSVESTVGLTDGPFVGKSGFIESNIIDAEPV